MLTWSTARVNQVDLLIVLPVSQGGGSELQVDLIDVLPVTAKIIMLIYLIVLPVSQSEVWITVVELLSSPVPAEYQVRSGVAVIGFRITCKMGCVYGS